MTARPWPSKPKIIPVNKNINASYNASMQRVATSYCLDGATVLAGARVNGDMNTTIAGGGRTAYICFSAVPCYAGPGNPPALAYVPPNSDTTWLHKENRELQLTPDYFWNVANGDCYFVAYTGSVNPYCNNAYRVAYYFGAGGVPQFVLTSRGQQKVYYALVAAHNLKNSGWNIAFGLTNEPNNLGGYVIDLPGDPNPCKLASLGLCLASWWPMDARCYAAVYQTVAGYIKDQAAAIEAGWNPAIGCGEVAEYITCQSSLLDAAGTHYDGVPDSVPEGHPDVRYPNLFLYWYAADGRPWTSPGGRDIHPGFITHHLYNDNAGTFVSKEQDAISSGPYGFRNSGYRTGQAPFSTLTYGTTEWASGATVDTQQRDFFNAVWNNPAFHNLTANGLRAAYWYTDFDDFENPARNVFLNVNPPGSCDLTVVGQAIQAK